MNNNKKSNKFSALRKKAEQKLLKQSKELSKQPAKDIQHTIHELQVHQIELELQNEELRRANEEIEESRSKYTDLYDFAPVGYFSLDKNGVILEVNLTGAKLLELERGLLIKKPFSQFVHKDYKDIFYLHRKKVFEANTTETCEIGLQYQTGKQTYKQRYVQLESITTKDSDGNVSTLLTTVSDITKRRLADEKLLHAKEEWETTFDMIPDIILVTDDQYRIVKVNKALADMVGGKREDLIGKFCYEVIHGTEKPPAYCSHSKTISEDKENIVDIYEDYLKKHFILSTSPIRDSEGKLYGTVEVFRNITKRKKKEEKLQETAITDVLTGLFNRRGFMTLSEQQCKLATRTNRRLTLLYLDVNNLKVINDEFGHSHGDQVLKYTTKILNKTFRKSDIIGRIGGDEFAVLITEPSETNIENIITDHININLKKHNEQYGRNIDLSFSLGFAHFDPEQACSIKELMTQADMLMYENKKTYKSEKQVIQPAESKNGIKRTHQRLKILNECWAELDTLEKVQIKNISKSGICVSTSQPLIADTIHKIKISSTTNNVKTYTAVVMWSFLTSTSAETSSYETGLKFIEMNDSLSSHLDNVITSLNS
jgi:diguanylate cyclase (GGDEF)-like protein/PAS domain S-box-containing protein